MGFFDDLMGKSAARGIKRTAAEVAGRTAAAGDAASGYYRGSRDAAQGYYQPYAEQGNQAASVYGGALGLRGQAGGQEAMTAYGHGANPFLEDQIGRNQASLLKSYNARGYGNSGVSSLAAARAGADMRYQDYNTWMGRLQGLQGQGLQVAGARAGVEDAYGQNMAGNEWQRAGVLNQNSINAQNGINQARAGGVNNLLTGLGSLAGTAFSAFAPGAGGQSAAGNMRNFLTRG